MSVPTNSATSESQPAAFEPRGSSLSIDTAALRQAGPALCVGPALLRVDDLVDPASFITKLRDGQGPVAQYLAAQFTAETTQSLHECKGQGQPPESIQKLLANELNMLLRRQCLYDEARFAGVPLSDETRKLLRQKPQDDRLVRLNRLLLEDAFPGDIAFQPYVGPRPFASEDRTLFFGRERETRDLRCLIVAHGVVLFYAQSGAGKTSLLNAGLVPLLAQEDVEVFPAARVRGVIPPSLDPDRISNIYLFNLLMSWASHEIEPERLASLSLAELLASQPRKIGRDGHPKLRVLIIDQFEELFTSYPDRWRERDEFFEQISEALEADRLLRVVFAMREEYLAHMDRFAHIFCEGLRTRFRLERMGGDSARRAVVQPLEGTGCSFDLTVAESLVQDLLESRIEDSCGKSVKSTGEFVEPVQLQVVCQNLWRELPPHTELITKEHLRKYGDVDDALKSFYERAVQLAVAKTRVSESQLRDWFDHRLITQTGIRGVVFRGPELTEGIPNAAVDVLENEHLIRAELRAGARWYELTHDRFIGPIQNANRDWRQDSLTQISMRLGRQLNRLWFFLAAAVVVMGVIGWQWRLSARLKAKADVAAEAARTSEELQRQAADSARRAEESEKTHKQKAKEAWARQITADAMRLVDDGDPMASLLWLGRALDLDRSREQVGRVRLRVLLSRLPRLVGLFGHLKTLTGVEFSPLGNQVVTASDDGTACLWDLQSGNLVHRLQHGAAVNYAAFSHDGRWLITASGNYGSHDGEAQIWDAGTGELVGAPIKHNDRVVVATFSRDQRFVVTASDDGIVQLSDAATGGLIKILPHEAAVTCAWFNHDATRIITASGSWGASNGKAQLWDIQTGEPIATLHHRGRVMFVALSPDDRELVATASLDGTARIWDPSSNRSIVLTHRNGVNHVAFSPDGKLLATAGRDCTARVWNMGMLVDALNNSDPSGDVGPDQCSRVNPMAILSHGGWVFRAWFSPDSGRVVTASRDRTARIWSAETGEPITPWLRHRGTVSQASFSPDGRLLATASAGPGLDGGDARVWDTADMGNSSPASDAFADRALFNSDGTFLLMVSGRDIRVWDTATWSVQANFSNPQAVTCVAFSPDGQLVASASTGGAVDVWNARTGELALPALRHSGEVTLMVMNRNATRLLTATTSEGRDSLAWIWDIRTGKLVGAPMPHGVRISAVCFSPDGTRLATATGVSGSPRLSEACVWDARTGERIAGPFGHDEAISRISFSHDGMHLLTACEDDKARVWDIPNGNELTHVSHTADVTFASFNADGTRIVTASQDLTARVWDTATGIAITPPLKHARAVIHASFSPLGQYVVTASTDNTARVWDAKNGEPVTQWIKHDGTLADVCFSPDGRGLFTASTGKLQLSILDLNPDSRPLPDLLQLGELIAGHRIDDTGGFVPLSSKDQADAWQVLRPKYPNEFYLASCDVCESAGPAHWAELARMHSNLGHWQSAVDEYSKAIELDPNDWQLWQQRARAFAELHNIPRAADDYAQAIEKGTDNEHAWHGLALCSLAMGDTARYRKTCAAMLLRFGNSRNPHIANLAAWTCALAPNSVPELDEPVRLAEAATRSDPNSPPYLLNTLGAVLFRAGRLQESVGKLHEAIRAYQPSDETKPKLEDETVWNWLFLAMAYHQQGNTAASQRFLKEATQWIRRRTQRTDANALAVPMYWAHRIEIQLLHREAESVINRN